MIDEDAAVPRFAVVGEALVDIVHRGGAPDVELPGGSCANVALALGRLGRHPILLTALGADARGERLRGWLDASGVTVHAAPLPRTSTATAVLGADGSATYDFDVDWTLESAPLRDSLSADVVHVGSLSALLAPGSEHVARLASRCRDESLVSYDLNIRPALLPDRAAATARVDAMIASADVVKASDEDAAWLDPDADPLDIARGWLERGAALAVVTLGAQGVIAVSDRDVLEVPAAQTAVADTIGAGDTFMAALLDGLAALGFFGAAAREPLRGIPAGDLEALLRHAAAAAAVTVSRPGADPPWRAELPDSPLTSLVRDARI
ncbi:PfkB family carbohydrate kinase [Microbacterium hominis]|uniref:Carbohydrate kinase n=1 Tax=Microbacterium hominis TaxID=162426 RepID=A0A7D4PT67_9MICO|nr:PfkB family carbohydrate kinase [Microbacterium hominis]QKJ18354.1 carbohydrate kinase [Microbacterium hominis]